MNKLIDGEKPVKMQAESLKLKTISMLIRLYVNLMNNSSKKINEQDSNILYALLENIFKFEEVSWEVLVQKIVQEETDEEEVLLYLNSYLSSFDKIRVILSSIEMFYADNDFSSTEISHILNLAKSLNITSTGFMELIETIESNSQNLAFITGFDFKKYKKSIFSDYILVGFDPQNQINLRKGNKSEALFFVLDKNIFVGINKNAIVKINGKQLDDNKLYYCPANSVIEINELELKNSDILKINENQLIEDVIEFKQMDYDFKIFVKHNRFHIEVFHGNIFLNNKLIPQKKRIQLFYDDDIQIENYDLFNLITLIRRRNKIGVKMVKPEEFFINYKDNFLSISLKNDNSTLTKAVLDKDDYYIQVPKRGWNLFVNNIKIDKSTKFKLNSDKITLNKMNFRINNHFDVVEIPFEIESIQLTDLKHFFNDGSIGLDRISLLALKGDLIAIMGKSGCGKSTLLKTLTAEIIPTYGSIEIDGENYYKKISYFSQYIGYVPQQDLLFPTLTVYENLLYRGQLRMPKFTKTHLDNKIKNILAQLNLLHKKDKVIGDENSNILSGGERKRVNLALELLFEPTIIIIDEPTSGLSSSDSEHIIDLLREITHQGKIIITTIHQPSSTIFEHFDKVLLMDMKGKEIFFGDRTDSFNYFDTELGQIEVNKAKLEKKKKNQLPEYFFDIINYPEYTETGDIIYEHSDENVSPKRKFNPIYWKEKFKRISLFQMIHFQKDKVDNLESSSKNKKRKLHISSYIKQLKTFCVRNFKIKIRNRTNLLITFLETPILAFLIAFILRLRLNDEPYTFHDNINMPVFIFISIILFIFLGLSNSIEEIFNERKMILREKLLNLKVSLFLTSKYLVMSLFSLMQVVIYYFITSPIIGFHGSSFMTILYLFASAMTGVSLGMLISSFINNQRALINILPLVLIPQIILGGAIIQFEKMNHRIKLNKHKPVPEIVEFIPTRWLFEGLMTGVAKNNYFNRKIAKISKRKLTAKEAYYNGVTNYKKYRSEVSKCNDEKSDLIANVGINKYRNSAINLSVNVMDGRFYNTRKNVFLSSFKILGKLEFRTFYFNLGVILFFIVSLGSITLIKLKLFYKG